MQSAAVQDGPTILKAMPIIQRTNIGPTEQFHLDEKMPGMMSVHNKMGYRMTGIGQIVDIDT
ncbi:hypothetical protein ACFLQK_00930 [bacterium]